MSRFDLITEENPYLVRDFDINIPCATIEQVRVVLNTDFIGNCITIHTKSKRGMIQDHFIDVLGVDDYVYSKEPPKPFDLNIL